MNDTTVHPAAPVKPLLRLAAGVIVVLAVVLVLVTALTSLTASTAAGVFVGMFAGAGLAIFAARRGADAARSRREADDSVLDELEPLRRDGA